MIWSRSRGDHPPVTYALDLTEAIGILTQGEMIDAAVAAGVSLDAIRARAVLDDMEGGYRLVRALAWVLRRRIEPDVSWEDAERWNVEAKEPATDPLGAEPAQKVTSA